MFQPSLFKIIMVSLSSTLLLISIPLTALELCDTNYPLKFRQGDIVLISNKTKAESRQLYFYQCDNTAEVVDYYYDAAGSIERYKINFSCLGQFLDLSVEVERLKLVKGYSRL